MRLFVENNDSLDKSSFLEAVMILCSQPAMGLAPNSTIIHQPP